jgi:hypothetical protein
MSTINGKGAILAQEIHATTARLGGPTFFKERHMDNSNFDDTFARDLDNESDDLLNTVDARGGSTGAAQIYMNMLWHYSAWVHLPSIVESGELRGSNAWAADELPMLWFSANQKWEPTATKMWRYDSGKVLRLTFKEQANHFGCIRFGLAAADQRLLNWGDACTVAGTPRGIRRTLQKVGKKRGGNPAHWFATPETIPLAELDFQVWGWSEGWCNTTGPKDMAEVWVKTRGTELIAPT